MDICVSSKTPLLPHDSTPGEIRCNPGGVARNVAHAHLAGKPVVAWACARAQIALGSAFVNAP